MKRTLAFLLLLAVALGCAAAFAEEKSFTVYDGTDSAGAFPFYEYNAYYKGTSQWIYPEADLAPLKKGDTITSLTFYIKQTVDSTSTNWQLYLMPTDATTLSSLVDYSTATLVYEGPIDCTGSTLTITFSTPYVYQGGNLLACSKNTTNGNYKNVNWYGENGHTNASYYTY